MANRITTLFDFNTSGASQSLAKLRTDLKNTEGFTNKVKVGAAGMGGMLKGAATEGALAAGAALVAFGVKGVQAFQETAIEAGKFADATGLAVDDASRWIEVAGDVGVSAETMEGVFLRLNKAIGDNLPVLEEYGIEAQKTADGQVDVNATMLEAIRVVGKIKDPTERAAAAQQLFGRSYAQAAEIVFASADSVAQKLGEVSEAKVIDEAELEKARKFRELMDNLQDAIQDMSLAAGEYLVPVLQDAGETIAELNEIIKTGTGGTNDLAGVIKGGLKVAMGDWRGAAEDAAEAQRDQTLATDLATTAIEAASEAARIATNDAYQKQVEANEDALHGLAAQGDRYVETLEQAGQAQKDVNDRLAESKRQADDASYAIQRLDGSWDSLRGDIEGANTWLDLQDQFDGVQTAAEEAWTAAEEGAEDAEQKSRDYGRATNDLKIAVGDYGKEVLNLPDEVVSELITMIDEGKKAEVEAFLARLGDGVTLPIKPYVIGGGGGTSVRVDENGNLRIVGAGSPGSPVRSGTDSFTQSSPGSQARGTQAPSGVTINVSGVLVGSKAELGRVVQEALSEWQRRGGR